MLIRLVRVVLLLLCFSLNCAANPADARFKAFLAAMGEDTPAREAFVRENCTERLIQKRGVSEIARIMDMLHADLAGSGPPRVMAHPDRFEALFDVDGGTEQVELVVTIGPPPASLIDGLTARKRMAPASGSALPPAESALPVAIKDLVEAQAAAGFSGAVLVAKAGETLYAGAFGAADRERGRANTLDTPFNLASNNKMYTALLIARLVELGKLDWQDKVGQHLPDWPQAAVRDQVTIAMLLSHTSGLGDYFGPAHAAALGELDTVAEYAALFGNEAPAGTPGTAFRYSNNGFVLLGLIAERITGRDYFDLVREHIYAPAAMQHSKHYRQGDPAVAIGYTSGNQPNTGQLALRGSPAGGGYSSASDLLRFATTLASGKLVKPATLALMTTRHADMAGPSAGYGYGFGVFDQGEPHFGHIGGAPGAHASFEIFPQSGHVVIVLGNNESAGHDLGLQIGQMILGRVTAMPAGGSAQVNEKQ